MEAPQPTTTPATTAPDNAGAAETAKTEKLPSTAERRAEGAKNSRKTGIHGNGRNLRIDSAPYFHGGLDFDNRQRGQEWNNRRRNGRRDRRYSILFWNQKRRK